MHVSYSWNLCPSVFLKGVGQFTECHLFVAYFGSLTALKNDDMKNIDTVGLNIESDFYFPSLNVSCGVLGIAEVFPDI